MAPRHRLGHSRWIGFARTVRPRSHCRAVRLFGAPNPFRSASSQRTPSCSTSRCARAPAPTPIPCRTRLARWWRTPSLADTPTDLRCTGWSKFGRPATGWRPPAGINSKEPSSPCSRRPARTTRMTPTSGLAWGLLAPHILNIGPWGDEHSAGRRLILATQLYLTARADVGVARPFAEDLLARWRHTLGPEHPDTLTAAVNLARCLQWLDEHDRSYGLGLGHSATMPAGTGAPTTPSP